MIIENLTNFAIPIPDVQIQGGHGIVLAPATTITIFNEAASSSKIIPILINAGLISNLGNAEPTQGNGIQVAGSPGPQGIQGPQGNSGITTWTLDIATGTVSGANLVMPCSQLLSTDKIISIVINMGSNPGRAVGGNVCSLTGYTAQANGTITLVFVDAPPPSGSITVSVTR